MRKRLVGEIQAMNETVYEQGQREERLRAVCELIEVRFCPLSQELQTHLQKMSTEQLRKLTLLQVSHFSRSVLE